MVFGRLRRHRERLRCAADILAGAKDIGPTLRAVVHTGEIEIRGDVIAGLALAFAEWGATWPLQRTGSGVRRIPQLSSK
jgi:hypothetical protein